MARQLIESDRAEPAQLLQLNVPKQEIAHRRDRHRSMADRELPRNSGSAG